MMFAETGEAACQDLDCRTLASVSEVCPVGTSLPSFPKDTNPAEMRKIPAGLDRTSNYCFEARLDSLRGALFCKTLTR